MIRTFLSLALVMVLTGLVGAQNANNPNAKADKGQKATITKVDAKNGTVTVKMKDKSGKEVEKTFKLEGDIRYFDSTGKAVAIDFFRSGDYVLMVEAEGHLKEMHKNQGDKDNPAKPGEKGQTGQPGQPAQPGVQGRQPVQGQEGGKLAPVDREFVMNAAEINMAEIKLGKLAEDRGSIPAVKDYGKRLVDDHTKMNAELRKFAESQEMMLPSKIDAKHEELYQSLSKVNGATFDMNFARDMAKGHQHAIEKFEAEMKNGQNPTLKTMAEKYVPVLRQHLQIARSIANQGK